MEAKEVVQRAYDLFGAGDMEGFMNEIVHDAVSYTHLTLPTMELV